MTPGGQPLKTGRVVEEGPPARILDGARTERARSFVGRILRH